MTLRPHPGVRVVTSDLLFQGAVFDLVRWRVELPSGLRQEWELIEHPGAIAVAALDGAGRLLVVRQYRPAAGDWTVELPAGRLDPGETPLAAARRELEEETGFRASTWRKRCAFLPAPGFCSEVMHLFEARDLEAVPGGGRVCDADEELEVLALAPEELLLRPLLDAKTLVAVQALLLERR